MAQEMMTWEDEAAAEARAAAEAESGGGKFFSTAGGRLKWEGEQVPGDTMGVVILDYVFENVMYEGVYDPDVIKPPTCFAFSRPGKDDDMQPHESVVAIGQAQHDECTTCEHNQWGSADTGRGKACRNTRRLAVIPAGTFDPKSGDFESFTDPEQFANAQIGYLKLPVTSTKNFGGYVKQVYGAWQRAPFQCITQVSVVPSKNQFEITFEALDKVLDDLREVITARHKEARESIEFPYNLTVEEPEPAPSRAARKPAGKKKAAAKKY